MGQYVGSRRKIDLLRHALNRPLAPGETAIAFHSIWEILPNLQSIPEPEGGTAMHLAIAQGANLRPTHTLIVSDGLPDDKAQALAAAKKLSGTISTLYLGPDSNHEAIAFMQKLARLGCGTAQNCDITKTNNQQLLGEQLKKLSLPPSQNNKI